MEGIVQLLGLNWSDFLWHTANFTLLIVLIAYFFYRPMVNMLDARTEAIRSSLEQAERAREEATRADQERDRLLAETRREVQDMLAQATQVAERIQADARQDAQQQAQTIIERARQEADAERAQAMAELRREVAGIAISAAERIISRSLDDQTHRQLVEEFLDERPAQAGRA